MDSNNNKTLVSQPYTNLAIQHDQQSDTSQWNPITSFLGLFCCCLWPLTVISSFVILNPQEEAVVLYWGKYSETIREPGLYWRNSLGRITKRISTKKICHELPRTTVLERNGNPLIVSAVVVYSFVETKKTALDIEDPNRFVENQAEAILKQVVSRFPYENNSRDIEEPCLKTEADQIGDQLCQALQFKIEVAGAQIHSFQLKEISYSPEISSAMLRRQQAQAIIDARQTIIQGACSIALEAIQNLEQSGIKFDREERTGLVTNILTVMCSDREAQPTLPLSAGSCARPL
eukprot:TRINITY_DN1216_c0_g1_i1.p1 TRINITY_DN1216_c0_g1~~TRINITY_DN1216_c0_g1_i1.p1  ORF type:complete len:290 (-),score=46.81 TRINITY_DN1216_c0_g1_i1:54-923(-)